MDYDRATDSGNESKSKNEEREVERGTGVHRVELFLIVHILTRPFPCKKKKKVLARKESPIVKIQAALTLCHFSHLQCQNTLN